MSKLKQLLSLKQNGFKSPSRVKSELATLPALVARFRANKEDREAIQNQARNASDLIAFLEWYLEGIYSDNVYSGGYREERAFADGKAKTAEEVYQALKGLTNDR